MKPITTAIAAALGLMASAVAAPQVGAPAPDFSGRATDDSIVQLSDYLGQRVVLEWTNDQCPFVQKHYGSGNMQSLQKLTVADGTVWLTINSSAPGKQGHVTPAEADQLTADRKAAPTAVLLDTDGEIGQLYAAKTTPHMYVIDEEGILRYAGAIDSIPTADPDDIARADNYVSLAVNALRSDKPVVVSQTSPYGCSVKY